VPPNWRARGRAWDGRFIERSARPRRTPGVRVLARPALSIAQVHLATRRPRCWHSYHEWDVAGSVAMAIEAGAVVLEPPREDTTLPTDGLLVAAPAFAGPKSSAGGRRPPRL